MTSIYPSRVNKCTAVGIHDLPRTTINKGIDEFCKHYVFQVWRWTVWTYDTNFTQKCFWL